MVKRPPDTLATEMKYSESIYLHFLWEERVEAWFGFHHFTTRAENGAVEAWGGFR
jgi:hypothetical protein